MPMFWTVNFWKNGLYGALLPNRPVLASGSGRKPGRKTLAPPPL